MSGIGSFISSLFPTTHADAEEEKPAPAEIAGAEEPKEAPAGEEVRGVARVRADEALFEKCQEKVQAGEELCKPYPRSPACPLARPTSASLARSPPDALLRAPCRSSSPSCARSPLTQQAPTWTTMTRIPSHPRGSRCPTRRHFPPHETGARGNGAPYKSGARRSQRLQITTARLLAHITDQRPASKVCARRFDWSLPAPTESSLSVARGTAGPVLGSPATCSAAVR
ncbi:hypothetical protein DFH09DRAFT_1290765 [Mycena vulgaris]|nr:hypothetical protein DFH09DRAFT_1290765 [Mycena vulgaris]